MNSDFGSRRLGSAADFAIECSLGVVGRQKPALSTALETVRNPGFLIVLEANYSELLWQLRHPAAESADLVLEFEDIPTNSAWRQKKRQLCSKL